MYFDVDFVAAKLAAEHPNGRVSSLLIRRGTLEIIGGFQLKQAAANIVAVDTERE